MNSAAFYMGISHGSTGLEKSARLGPLLKALLARGTKNMRLPMPKGGRPIPVRSGAPAGAPFYAPPKMTWGPIGGTPSAGIKSVPKPAPMTWGPIGGTPAAGVRAGAGSTSAAAAPGTVDSIKNWFQNITGKQVGMGAAIPAGLLGLYAGSASPDEPGIGMPSFPIFPDQGMMPPGIMPQMSPQMMQQMMMPGLS